MPRLAVEKWELEHRKHVADYLAQLDELYELATDEIVRLGLSYTYDPTTGKPFYFRLDKTRNQAVNSALSNFREKVIGIVSAGIATEWEFANMKTDSWVKQLFSDPKKGYMLHNLKAMEAYTHRKTYGHTLSDRVWNYTAQFKEQIELSLSVGLSEGRSAAQISRDVRIHLNEPDKLFRRVRNQFGDLVLSKSARAYHPGQGVYRSSYQNAMRMARTEINGAYREADYIRWQQLDFIVGIEVKVSKSHPAWLAKEWIPRFKNSGRPAPAEICDEMAGRYPKEFKFIGWHPNCRCYAVPIIANEDTDVDWWEEPQNEVTTTPKGFKDWVKKNKERILKAEKDGKLPYFLSENKGYANLRPEKTAAQKQAIIDRWKARKVEYKKATNLASNVLKAAKQYPEVDVDKLQALYDAYRIKEMREEAKKVASQVAGARKAARQHAISRKVYTREQLDNFKEIERILGVKRGAPMTVEEADMQNANPNFFKSHEYRINCQTCAPAYVLRTAGFDINAKGNTPGSLSQWISRSHSFDIWKTLEGNPCTPTLYNDWMKTKGYANMTRKRYRDFFEENCKEEGIYIVTIKWSKNRGAHATILQRFSDGTLSYIEPQHYIQGRGVRIDIDALCREGAASALGQRGVLRVDDKLFDTNYLSIFNK